MGVYTISKVIKKKKNFKNFKETKKLSIYSENLIVSKMIEEKLESFARKIYVLSSSLQEKLQVANDSLTFQITHVSTYITLIYLQSLNSEWIFTVDTHCLKTAGKLNFKIETK